MPKFSIIIPIYNGMPYLKSCVQSIISQNYQDYELIISDDHSSDGSSEFIDSLKEYKNVKILHRPQNAPRLSMAEHWEWVQSFASGKWQIFVGQDDGLQGYFFQLAEKLTDICEKKDLQVIMSERAYFFWQGYGDTYGQTMVNFPSWDCCKILKVKREIKNALYYTDISYLDFPSMYTTSLFSSEFLETIKEKQNGKIFTTHPQDANLAALVAVFQKKYLKSYIPLGWVGTSPKSAGLAIDLMQKKESKLGNEYLESVNKSTLKTHPLAGNFLLSSMHIYFWGALLAVAEKQNKKLYNWLISYKTKQKLFSKVNMRFSFEENAFFKEVLDLNNFSSKDLRSFIWLKFKFFNKVFSYSLGKKYVLNFLKDSAFELMHGECEGDMSIVYNEKIKQLLK